MPRGKPGSLCWRHIRGVEPGTPPFFEAGCVRCEANKAAGKVTGNETTTPERRRAVGDRRTKASIAATRARRRELLPLWED